MKRFFEKIQIFWCEFSEFRTSGLIKTFYSPELDGIGGGVRIGGLQAEYRLI